jgi:hypothetical protein
LLCAVFDSRSVVVCCNAVFSTNLLHAASKWTVPDYPRCNIFQRFQLSAYFVRSQAIKKCNHDIT